MVIFLILSHTDSFRLNIFHLPFSYCRQSSCFKTDLPGRGFHTLIRNASFHSPINEGSHNPPPLGASVLVGTSHVFGSNTIYNSPNPQLADIVHFSSLCIVISFTVLKNATTRERFSHSYKECFVPLSNRCGTSHHYYS